MWSQIHADVIGRRIRQVTQPVLANVRGARRCSRCSPWGASRSATWPPWSDTGATYEPDPSQAPVYDELFTEFVNLYKQTKQIHRRLNRH